MTQSEWKISQKESEVRKVTLIKEIKILRERALNGDRESLGDLLIAKLCMEMDITSKPLRELLVKFCDETVEEAKNAKTVTFGI